MNNLLPRGKKSTPTRLLGLPILWFVNVFDMFYISSRSLPIITLTYNYATQAWNRSGYQGDRFKLAVGSFKEEYANEIKIIQLDINAQIDEASNNQSDDTQTYFNEICNCEHPYPATKILWAPQSHQTRFLQLLFFFFFLIPFAGFFLSGFSNGCLLFTLSFCSPLLQWEVEPQESISYYGGLFETLGH